MTIEDTHLLVTEKHGHSDMETCQSQKANHGLDRNCSETQVFYDQRFWTCVAFGLLTLTIISAAFQFCPKTHMLRKTGLASTSTVAHAVPMVSATALDSTEADISKSIFFNIIGFSDLGTKQNPVPRRLYKSVGETVVRDGKAYLTSQITTDDSGVVPKPHSVGRLMHPRPFRMKHRGLHPGQERVVSFHTTFVFSIKNLVKDREATGDGFAFLMVPQNNVLGSGGGYLGVMNSTNVASTFAVEFDIWQNPALRDISNNHVGINVNSMVSVVASDAGYWSQDEGADRPERFNRLDLTSGKIQAWIDYDGRSKDLTVSISPKLGFKPLKPLLSKRLDLTKVFEKYMYVGFSAATGQFSAKHIIHNWKFEKHSNPQSGGFTAPKFRNPHASRPLHQHLSALILPSTSKRCSDLLQKLSTPFYSFVTDLSTDLFSEAKKLLQLRPYVLLGFILGLAFLQIGPCLYHTCVACCVGPVECYESTRELQELAEADKKGRFILVLSEPQSQEHPRVCSVV